jgi:hypothetical protein
MSVDTKKIRAICDAIDKGKTILSFSGAEIDMRAQSYVCMHWTVKEPPQQIEAHGRTYDLRPLPEKRKARNLTVKISPDGYVYVPIDSEGWPSIKVREVLEDEK